MTMFSKRWLMGLHPSIPGLEDGASPGSVPQQPVLGRPKRHQALRIGWAVVAALLVAGLALSWLALAQKLRPSSPGTSSHPRQAPTAGPTTSPKPPQDAPGF